MWLEPDKIEDVSPHQREQLAAAMTANVGILTGGPGTGKTHSVTRLVRAWRKHVGSPVAIVTPTGKAASRLNEIEPTLTARTTHSTLQPSRNGHDGDGWGFEHNESNPLKCGLLVGDEQSMTDAGLMASLLGAVSAGTKVLMVGDPEQLPPVGRGKPFLDMIRAGLPHGHLTEIHRFAGRIATVCDQIKKGERWHASPKVDLEGVPPENFRHIETQNPFVTMATVKGIMQQIPARGWNPIDDCQVLCAVNEKSPLSRARLNQELRQMLNPDGEEAKGVPFRKGDKVICTRNHFHSDEEQGEPAYIANGDSGRVAELGKASFVVKVGERHFYVKKDSFGDWELFYAGTVHKFQGSQAKCVVTIADDYPGANFVCDRSWHYTAYSRASKLSIVVGKRSTIDRHCQTVGMKERKTFLTERISRWFHPQHNARPA